MSKRRVNPDWFKELRTVGLKDRFEWLAQLSKSVDSLASFGCWSVEPFALIWTLDAAEAKVVELREEHLAKPREELERLKQSSLVTNNPLFGCLDGRSIEFIVGDMTTEIDKLPSNHFDLAYCEDVLYQIQLQSEDLTRVQSAINEMTRVVKPGKWVIAVEPKIGAEVEEVTNEFLSQLSGRKITQHIVRSEPINISPMFKALDRQDLCDAPDWSYCYRKRQG
jgi:SAM-dependent methyltransferase